ncbi:hypothetical protein [Kamptonema formosum]|uniref:hypothetical protein n=1 Tax=Kamptonema formosum TaxID=331992 RepID=UPI00034D6247|nr:hypothetical protein [Oscillatoria sp. PCC 10802]
MLQHNNLELLAMINDIDALIAEIDNNPRISSWVIRLVLKSMKDKARKMALEAAQTQSYLDRVIDVEALPN